MNNIKIRELKLIDYNGVREIDELTQRIYRGKKWDTLNEEEKEEFMTSRKIKEIEAGINPDNPPSIKLHKQVGFKVNDWKKAILKL